MQQPQLHTNYLSPEVLKARSKIIGGMTCYALMKDSYKVWDKECNKHLIIQNNYYMTMGGMLMHDNGTKQGFFIKGCPDKENGNRIQYSLTVYDPKKKKTSQRTISRTKVIGWVFHDPNRPLTEREKAENAGSDENPWEYHHGDHLV